MLMSVYTVYDSKAGCYTRPFFTENDETAKRFVVDFYLSQDSPIARHPEDFCLYCIGTFDDNACLLVGEVKRHVIDLQSFYKPEGNEDDNGQQVDNAFSFAAAGNAVACFACTF